MPPFATLTAQTLTRPVVVDVEFSISIRQENNWATAHRGKAVGAVFFYIHFFFLLQVKGEGRVLRPGGVPGRVVITGPDNRVAILASSRTLFGRRCKNPKRSRWEGIGARRCTAAL